METALSFPQYRLASNPLKIFDAPRKERDTLILDTYFNDIYRLFVSKFSRLGVEDRVTTEEKVKLRSLLNELIKVKTILEENDLN